MQGAHGHFPFANGDHSCLQMGGAEVVYSYWFPMKYFSKNYIEVSCWHHIRPHAIGPLSQAMHPRDHAASDEACRGVPLHGSASAELHCLTVLVANACGLLPLWCVQLRSEGNSGSRCAMLVLAGNGDGHRSYACRLPQYRSAPKTLKEICSLHDSRNLGISMSRTNVGHRLQQPETATPLPMFAESRP